MTGPDLTAPPARDDTAHLNGGDILDADQRRRVELIRHLAGSHPSVRYLLGVIDDIAPGRH